MSQIVITKEKCIFLPDQECVINACQNWCKKRNLFNLFPMWISNKNGNFEFKSAEEYEAFIKACPHDNTWTERGCDGVVAFEKVHCSKCGLILSSKGEQVWGDACV